MSYSPDHPMLQQAPLNWLTRSLTHKQIEALLRLWDEGWRFRPGFPRLSPGGVLIVSCERMTVGGIDYEGNCWLLTTRITSYGEELGREIVDV